MESELVDEATSVFKTRKFWASVLAELFGTGFLVFIVSSASDVSPGDKASGNGLHVALAYGLGSATLMHWTQGLLNPALVVAFTSTGNLTLLKGVLFIIIEIIGGLGGAALTYSLSPANSRSILTFGDPVLHKDITTIQGLFVELILTFIFTLAVYAAKDPGRNCKGYDASLAYGFAVAVCHLVGYRSCGVNPARSFGPAVVRQIFGVGKPRTEWEYHWIYWIGPVVGSLLAGVTYHFLYSQQTHEYNVYQCHVTARNQRHRESETNL